MRPLLALLLLSPAVQAQDEKPRYVKTLPLSPAAAPEPALRYRLMPPREELTPGNAVIDYARAFNLAREQERPDSKKYHEQLNRLMELPVDDYPEDAVDETREFLDRHRDFFDVLDRAARRSRCDWQLEEELSLDGIDVILAEIQHFREMAYLLSLRIRFAIVESRFEDAIHALQTGYAMARHVGNGPTMIHVLVGIAISAIQTGHVEKLLARPGAPNLYWALATLPRPFVELRHALGGEARLARKAFPEYEALSSTRMTAAEADRLLTHYLTVWARLDFRPAPSAEEILRKYPGPARQALAERGVDKAFLESIPDSQVVLLQAADAFRRGRWQSAKWLLLPPGDAYRLFEAAGPERLPDLDTLGGLFQPVERGTLHKIAEAVLRTERMIAALRAVEAVRMQAAADGGKWPGSLDDVTVVPVPNDPYSDKPFGYEADVGSIRVIAPPYGGHEPNSANTMIFELIRIDK